MKHIISSESVTEGHPDKICDKISDAILDECLRQDPESRVACETAVKTGMVMLLGEVTTKAKLDVQKIVRDTVNEIGYNRGKFGFDSETCSVLSALSEQSPDISQGVSEGTGEFVEQGAGDQGLMYGFACNETPELMPLPIVLAHKLSSKLSEVRKNGTLSYLRPDGKSQVAVEYENGKPLKVKNVIIASQHGKVSMEKLREDVMNYVIKPVCGNLVDNETQYFINATGKFELGGPAADAGLTGRKIIVDTYGGVGRHGGGAFSGKDPSKVDRSSAYAARYIAKNLVGAGLADKCEVQLAYVIGVAEPTSIHVDTFGTGKVSDEELVEAIKKVFPTKPKVIIECLGLKNPSGWCYKDSAAYGHFGRSEFPWEKLDKVEELQKLFNLIEIKEKVIEF